MLRDYFHSWFSKPAMQNYIIFNFGLVVRTLFTELVVPRLPNPNSIVTMFVISNKRKFDRKISRERAAWHGILPCLALQLALLASKIYHRR